MEIEVVDNQWLLNELTDRIQTHYYEHGFPVQMTKWACVYTTKFEVVDDDALVGVIPVQYIDFYPMGEYKCGNCHQLRTFNHKEHAYFHYDNNFMICGRCNAQLKEHIHPQFPKMSCRVVDNQEFSSNDDVITIHNTPLKERVIRRQFKHACKRAEAKARRYGKVFLDGLCTIDIWHSILARRVIKAFRSNVTRRTREKVAYVICNCTSLSAVAANDIVNQCI